MKLPIRDFEFKLKFEHFTVIHELFIKWQLFGHFVIIKCCSTHVGDNIFDVHFTVQTF